MKFKGNWLPEKQIYKETCLRLAKDLTNFKQDKDYIYYVGNDVRGQAVVEAFDKVVKLPYIKENDKIGNPRLHNGKSAGTLRFMKVYQDIQRFKYNDIVEVGGGYGGQCLVIQKIKPVKYTIIDIPAYINLYII